MRRSPLALAGAAVLAAGLTLGGAGVALAQDTPPAPGSAACDSLVATDLTVRQASNKVDNLTQRIAEATATDPVADPDADPDATPDVVDVKQLNKQLVAAKADLEAAKVAAVASLCTGGEETTTPPPSDDPTSSPTPPPDDPTSAPPPPPVDVDQRIRGEIAALECDDSYFADRGHVYDEIGQRVGQPDYAELFGLAIDKDRELNLCTDSTIDLSPLDDDGSQANISGDEVTEVPSGSAQTGEA